MQRHKLAILATTLSALLMSGAAMASDLRSSAAVPGPGAHGGEGCTLYSYSITKLAVDHDGRDVDVASIADDHDDFAKFKIIVRNLGDCDLRRIRVTDFLPRGTELVDADPHPTFQDDHRIVWEDQRIEEGDRLVFRVTVKNRHHHDEGRWITNTACAFTPLIGIRICGSANALLDDDHHEPTPVH